MANLSDSPTANSSYSLNLSLSSLASRILLEPSTWESYILLVKTLSEMSLSAVIFPEAELSIYSRAASTSSPYTNPELRKAQSSAPISAALLLPPYFGSTVSHMYLPARKATVSPLDLRLFKDSRSMPIKFSLIINCMSMPLVNSLTLFMSTGFFSSPMSIVKTPRSSSCFFINSNIAAACIECPISCFMS